MTRHELPDHAEHNVCEACRAMHPRGRTCEDCFHTVLGWEHQREALRAQHHLLVLTYHLQHPHLYSPEGLAYGRQLLADFLVGLTPTLARARGRAMLGSDTRKWPITATATSHGSYVIRPEWPVTIADVVNAGIDDASEQVPHWARTTQNTLDRLQRAERAEA